MFVGDGGRVLVGCTVFVGGNGVLVGCTTVAVGVTGVAEDCDSGKPSLCAGLAVTVASGSSPPLQAASAMRAMIAKSHTAMFLML